MRSTPAVRLPHWSLPPTCTRTAELVEEVQVVVRLKQHVAELGVADALFAVFQPCPHGLLGHHRVDREVLANIAQVFDQRHLAQPVGVVHQQRAVFPLEREKTLELAADMLSVFGDLLGAEQHPLFRFARWDRQSCLCRRPPAAADDGPRAENAPAS